MRLETMKTILTTAVFAAGVTAAGETAAVGAISVAQTHSPVQKAIAAEVTGLQHIGIPTRNMAATTEFYGSLGFSLIAEKQNGESLVRFFQYKNVMLEVWESHKEAPGIAGAINHIALDTKNADALYPVIKDAQYTMLNDKVMFLPFWEHGIKYFNIKGPNGEVIEFCEKVKN